MNAAVLKTELHIINIILSNNGEIRVAVKIHAEGRII